MVVVVCDYVYLAIATAKTNVILKDAKEVDWWTLYTGSLALILPLATAKKTQDSIIAYLDQDPDRHGVSKSLMAVGRPWQSHMYHVAVVCNSFKALKVSLRGRFGIFDKHLVLEYSGRRRQWYEVASQIIYSPNLGRLWRNCSRVQAFWEMGDEWH